MNTAKSYDVIVIGAGHAGCEAALAAARMGMSTCIFTMNLDTIGQMSCNPAIGGLAKGHLVREIDALGGEIAKVTDRAGIQFRMLNKSEGPAVWSLRAQADRVLYRLNMRKVLETQEKLDINAGGTLITCSCSYNLSEAEFLDLVRQAAVSAGRRVRLMERRGAARDHPAFLTLPESLYLKCLFLEAW